MFKFLPRFLDIPLLVAIVFLLSLSCAVIYSTEIGMSFSLSSSFFFRQLIFSVVGLAIYLVVAYLGFKLFENSAVPLFIIIFFLLIVTFILGVESRGSVRWINLGFFAFQPTEFAKPILALFLVQFFETRSIGRLVHIVIALLLVVPTVILTYLQPDLGSAIILGVVLVASFFLLGLPWRYIVGTLLVGLVLFPLFWTSLHDYQRQRIFTFLNPQGDPTGTGYHAIQSLIAVGSGKMTGLGYGRGTQSQLDFLPEKHTDFIFAHLSEELGFVGSSLLILTFAFLIYRLLILAQKISSDKARVFIYVMTTTLAMQAFINIGMNIGIMPITGITLPLVSYGGSSLVSTLFTLGLVQASLQSYKK